MPKMLYIPKDLKNIKDRPKVYFCCHPEDFDRCFDMLTKDIMSKQKCTIWYAEDLSEPRDEEYLEDLRQMQLFVMPVTTKLLYTENIALSVEFAFAIENHIPVLPIILDISLAEEFNEKCGDLQFLDKYSSDVTAISYDEKLRKFLEAVLIGDETAQRIRDAFDAYIFLSYRKKDRRQAQELMRLIHKNDFCRDIAIWYDEFLSIGEDFNENIAEALSRSQLFALAVTPNLINEENYVQSTEYPMAVKSNKLIIPAEVVPTDRKALREKFMGIPEIVDAHDEYALFHMLRYALDSTAIRRNDNSPEHNFFIGLAYLSGIDVEVDNDRALELITSSAEAGLAEAAGKLVEMYRNGIGVKRDYHTAIKWQEKKIEILKNEYKENPNEDLLHMHSVEIINCGDFYNEIKKLSEALQCYTEVMFMVMAHEYPDIDKILYRDLITSYERIGYVYVQQQKLKASIKYYEKAMRLCEKLAFESNTDEAYHDLSISYYKMGVSLRKQGDLQGSLVYHKKAFEIDIVLAERNDSYEIRRSVYWDYTAIGDILKAQGDLKASLECYKKAHEVVEKLYSEDDSIQNTKDLSISYNSIGDLLEKQGDVQGAVMYYSKAIQLMEEVDKQTEDMLVKMTLSQQYINMGGILRAQGDARGAYEYFDKALDIRTELVKAAPTPFHLEMLALVCCDIASVYPKKEREFLNIALNIYQKLIADYPEGKQGYMENLSLIKQIISNL